MYLIIQKGYNIFGKGKTKKDAIEDMKQWINQNDDMQEWTIDDFERNYESASIGSFVLCLSNEYLTYIYEE